MSVSPPDGFALIKPGQTYLGKQGIVYSAGASKETVGAQKICMNVMPMPPGAVPRRITTRISRRSPSCWRANARFITAMTSRSASR